MVALKSFFILEVMMSDFHGFATRSLSNPYFTLDVLAAAGPRIVRLIPAGTDLNLLAEVPTVFWESPHGRFYPLGGHRLWAGPEFPQITYVPDHTSAEVEETPQGLCIRHDDHFEDVSYRRQIDIRVDPNSPKITLVHLLKNLGKQPLQVLPWAITQFRMGGKVRLPLSTVPADPHTLLPNRNLVLWPYTRFEDKRFNLDNAQIEIDATPDEEALKVGVYTPEGWAAIEFAEGYVLTKRFKVFPHEQHSDYNTNLQCYVRDSFIELETLGVLSTLAPQEEVTHIEEWELKKGSLADL